MTNHRKYGFTAGVFVAALLLVAGSCSSPNATDVNGGFGRPPTGGGDCTTNPTAQGCPCAVAGETIDCGEIIRRSNDFVTCSMGKRTCSGGVWGTCEGDKIALHSVAPLGMGGLQLQGTPVPCTDDPCNPNCYTFDDDGGIEAGTDFVITEGGLTISPVDSGCTNLTCQIVSCDGGLQTTLTGIVTDPAGQRPINGASVYVPNSAVTPFPAGVQNDPCGGGGTLTGSPIVVTQTAVDGTFTLTNVPAGANIPLVIQTGRWRRQVTIPNVPACATTDVNAALGFTGNCAQPAQGSCAHSLCTTGGPLTIGCQGQGCVAAVCAADSYCCAGLGAWDATCVNEVSAYCQPMQCPACPAAPPANYGALHLPQDRTQGDIPQMALVTGGCDMFECLLKRIGLHTSEFTNQNGSGRIHMYQGMSGYNLAGGATFMDQLFASQAQVNNYNIVLLPCDCGSEYNNNLYGSVAASTAQSEIVSYANVGGRVFASHWGRNWIERDSGGGVPFPNVANWIGDLQCLGSINGTVDTSFAKGQTFANWLGLATVGASNPFSLSPVRFDVTSVISPTEQWVYEASNGCGGPAPAVVNLAFNAPLGAMQKNGRVAFSDTHVSSQDGYSPLQFPTICNPNNTMTAQEKALEYMFFDLSACAAPVIPPYNGPVSYALDYNGQCPNGQKVVWRFFDWKAIAPPDSHIDFQAATASTQGGLGSAMSVSIGSASVALNTASSAPPAPVNWVGTDVSTQLQVKSQDWLRVTMTFYPSSNNLYAPTLSAWRQLFDCVDNL